MYSDGRLVPMSHRGVFNLLIGDRGPLLEGTHGRSQKFKVRAGMNFFFNFKRTHFQHQNFKYRAICGVFAEILLSLEKPPWFSPLFCIIFIVCFFCDG